MSHSFCQNRFWANSCCVTISCCSEPSTSPGIHLNRIFWSTFIWIRILIPIKPVNSFLWPWVVDDVIASTLARIHSKPDMISCSILHKIRLVQKLENFIILFFRVHLKNGIKNAWWMNILIHFDMTRKYVLWRFYMSVS